MTVKGVYFGNYLLLAKLAKGGMAQVCVAKSFGAAGFERLVAIKQLLPEFSKDAKFVPMFIDEAKIASKLNHANICQIYELGQKDDTLYIAMEYVHGRDIYTILRKTIELRQLIPARFTAAIIAKIADALDYAHRKKDENGQSYGIVHRDVSPQNILLSFDGDVKLIDFGIAKAKDRVAKTQAGIIKGKFIYMSPEQITDNALDGRSDIFALGAVLYEMLSGGVPAFKGANDMESVRNVATSHYRPLTHYNQRCSQTLCRIVDKALALNKEDRYQRAADMSADLQRYLLNEAGPVSEQDFAEYMQSLFAEEWSDELEKIQYFRSVKAPALNDVDTDVLSLAKTVVSPSRKNNKKSPSSRRNVVSAASLMRGGANPEVLAVDQDFDPDRTIINASLRSPVLNDASLDQTIILPPQPVPHNIKPCYQNQTYVPVGRKKNKFIGWLILGCGLLVGSCIWLLFIK